jgi:hypothetical protein
MLPLVIVFAAGQCLGLATLLLQALRPGIAATPTPDTADSRAAGTIALSGPNPV